MNGADASRPSDAASAHVMAAMLQATRLPSGLTAFMLAAVATGLVPDMTQFGPWPTLVCVPLLAWQLVLGWRLHLDAQLFSDFADASLHPADLDRVLSELALRAPASPARTMPNRCIGAKRLLRHQTLLTISTLGLMLVSRFLAASAAHV